MKKQKAAEQDRACVAIHGIRECSRDLPDIREQCEYFDYNVYVFNVVRIGRPAKSSKKPRLLKVLLQTVIDKTLLLKVSKYLREDPFTAAIFITSWLSSLEMANLRSTQSHCRQLNDQMLVMRDGRKPYVVISSRLMERTSKGNLCLIRDDVVSASSNTNKVPNKICGDVSDKKLDSNSTNVSATGVLPFSVLEDNIVKSSQSKNACGGSHVAPN